MKCITPLPGFPDQPASNNWLTDSLLKIFYDIHDDYYFYGCSAMNNVCSSGILRGRPFDWVGFLCLMLFIFYL